ncbi:MAG: hypothetical protein AAGJ46_01170 [Planctomycetota bacterium]
MAARPKKNQRSEAKPAAEPAEAPQPWRLAFRVAVSVWVLWHLFVLLISPLSVSPTSPLVAHAAQFWAVRAYSDPLYLNHGYHFFGPDPPTYGRVIRYQVFDEAGGVKTEGEFPNLDQQWPRLWYHRHMMLADQAAGVGVFGDPQADQRLTLTAYARHLLQKHEGEQIRLECFRHYSLHPADVRGDVNPNQTTEPADPYDQRFYESEAVVVQRRSDLETPLVPNVPTPPGQGGAAEEIPIGVGR